MSASSTRSDNAVGGGDYVVAQGESIGSVAYKHGLLPDTVWEDAGNRELREARKNKDVLYPGDRLVVPKLRKKSESVSDQQRHTFRRKGVPAWLRLQFQNWDGPRANEPYVVLVEGRSYEGTTDGEGRLAVPIPPDAKRAEVRVGDPPDVYDLDLATVDPIETTRGVQGRLFNLGYAVGGADGSMSDDTRKALEQFRADHGLPGGDGDPDDALRQALEKAHGS